MEDETIEDMEKEALIRFRRQMFAKISEIAAINHTSKEIVEEELKRLLIKKNYIKESTKELKVNQLAKIITFLINKKNAKA